MKATLRLFCFAVLFAFVSQVSFAQGVASGDLHVTVKDPKGNMVSAATVTVRDVAKGLERTGTPDGQGGYSLRLLPPGIYSVTVEVAGFAKAEAPSVSITVGQMAELPVTLTIASGKEVIEVSSEAALVETSRSSSTDTIGQRRIDNLPINGRNYINFTLTDSRVVRDNAPNTGAAPTSGLNMSGQRARSNLVNVDGADATDNSVNGVRSTVSQEAVQEFQIITNNYEPEYGRASGGVVNIITRSGSNEFHGDVFGYLRNRNFQAVNPFSTVSDPAYTRVWWTNQEGQNVLLLFLRNYAAPRDGFLQHRAGQFRFARFRHHPGRIALWRPASHARTDCFFDRPRRTRDRTGESRICSRGWPVCRAHRRFFGARRGQRLAHRLGSGFNGRPSLELGWLPNYLRSPGTMRSDSRILPDAGLAKGELSSVRGHESVLAPSRPQLEQQ